METAIQISYRIFFCFYSSVILEIHFPKEQQAFAPRKIQSSLSLINS